MATVMHSSNSSTVCIPLVLWIIYRGLVATATFHTSILFNKKTCITELLLLCSMIMASWYTHDYKTKLWQTVIEQVVQADVRIEATALSEGSLDKPNQVFKIIAVQRVAAGKNGSLPMITVGQRVRLSAEKQVLDLSHVDAGTQLQVRLQLLPLKTTTSPHTFNAEQWLLSRHISARAHLLHVYAVHQPPFVQQISLTTQLKYAVERQRMRMRWYVLNYFLPNVAATTNNRPSEIANVTQRAVAVFLGLLTGDKLLFDPSLQQLYNSMGMQHVMAISGPHVWLAAFMLVMIGHMGLNRFPAIYRRERRAVLLLLPWAGALVAYGLLVGLEPPAMRTALMLLGGLILRQLLHIPIRFSHLCAYTLLLLVALDPAALYSISFILTFLVMACVFITAALVSMLQTVALSSSQPYFKQSIQRLGQNSVLLFILAQGVFTLVSLPLLLFIFGQYAYLAPIANLWLVPIYSLCIVPLVLVGGIMGMISHTVMWWIWSAAIKLLALCHTTMQWLHDLFIHKGGSLYFNFPLTVSEMLLVYLSGALLVISLWWLKTLRIPTLALIGGIVFTLNMPKMAYHGRLNMIVFDVGQGLSVLIETPHHRLLFDTGASQSAWGTSRFRQVVLPYLQAKRIHQLDMLVVSHLDDDHSGGVSDVIKAERIGQILSSEVMPNVMSNGCKQGQAWTWDGVEFAFLAPEAGQDYDEQNEASCVLSVSAAVGEHRTRFVITGDAGLQSEQYMVKHLQSQPDAQTVLVLGHHGSKTSTGEQFIRQLSPIRAVVSAGVHNRYGHPHAVVVERLKQHHILIDSTQTQGTLVYNVNRLGQLAVIPFRQRSEMIENTGETIWR